MASAARKPAIKRANKFFTPKSEGVTYLIKEFTKYSSDPSTGINYNLVQNKEIREIFHRHPVFADYSERAFCDQFKKYATNFRNEQNRTRDFPRQKIPETSAATTKRPIGKLYFFSNRSANCN